MKIADLISEIAQSAFEEFFDTWHSTWGATRQLQDIPRTNEIYFKGLVVDDPEEVQ